MIFSNIEQAVLAVLEQNNDVMSAVNYAGRRGVRNIAPPYVMIEPLRDVDWSVKDRIGHELRLSLSLAVPDADPDRLHPLMDAVRGAMETLPRALGNWQLVTCTRIGTRTLAPARNASGAAGSRSSLWLAAMDYRLRVIAVSD